MIQEDPQRDRLWGETVRVELSTLIDKIDKIDKIDSMSSGIRGNAKFLFCLCIQMFVYREERKYLIMF